MMEARASYNENATTGTAASMTRSWQASTEVAPRYVPHDMPPSIDVGQAYYWRYAWQVGERESRAELERGEKRTFASAEDAIRWLLSDDKQ
jgi:hypothetical protein